MYCPAVYQRKDIDSGRFFHEDGGYILSQTVGQKNDCSTWNKELVLSTEVNEKDGNVGGGDTRDARGLGNGRRTIAHQFLTALDGERLNGVEIEVGWNLDILQAIILFRLLLLPLNIASIFKGNLDRLNDLIGECSTWNNL